MVQLAVASTNDGLAGTVCLERVHLADAADLSDGIRTYSAQQITDARVRPVEVRVMASGRVRTVTRPGSTRTVNITLRMVSSDEVLWLLDHRGRVVLLRDTRGRKVYGVFGEVSPTQMRDRSGWDVPLTVQAVSWSEAV